MATGTEKVRSTVLTGTITASADNVSILVSSVVKIDHLVFFSCCFKLTSGTMPKVPFILPWTAKLRTNFIASTANNSTSMSLKAPTLYTVINSKTISTNEGSYYINAEYATMGIYYTDD